MRSLTMAYDKLLRWLGLLPGVMVAVIAVGTCADVLLRNAGYGGLYGMLEVVEYSLLILVMAGAGYIMRIGRHITVDILSENLPQRFSRPLAIGATGLGTVFSIIFLWYGLKTTFESYQSGAMIQRAFVIPEWWVVVLIPIGFFFLTIELLRRLYITVMSREIQGTGGTGRDGGL